MESYNHPLSDGIRSIEEDAIAPVIFFFCLCKVRKKFPPYLGLLTVLHLFFQLASFSISFYVFLISPFLFCKMQVTFRLIALSDFSAIEQDIPCRQQFFSHTRRPRWNLIGWKGFDDDSRMKTNQNTHWFRSNEFTSSMGLNSLYKDRKLSAYVSTIFSKNIFLFSVTFLCFFSILFWADWNFFQKF